MSGKSSSKARAKISDIIADAKASLAEPTRPVTPAGGFTPHGTSSSFSSSSASATASTTAFVSSSSRRSMSSATVTSMYTNQYNKSVSASYSSSTSGGGSSGSSGTSTMNLLNVLRNKRLKPLNHHISSTSARGGGTDADADTVNSPVDDYQSQYQHQQQQQQQQQRSSSSSSSSSYTQGPSQSGHGRYQMQTFEYDDDVDVVDENGVNVHNISRESVGDQDDDEDDDDFDFDHAAAAAAAVSAGGAENYNVRSGINDADIDGDIDGDGANEDEDDDYYGDTTRATTGRQCQQFSSESTDDHIDYIGGNGNSNGNSSSVRDTTSSSDFLSLLNDVNDAIDNLSNVHALLATSVRSVRMSAGAGAGAGVGVSSGSATAAASSSTSKCRSSSGNAAAASYSPEIAFILSSLCVGSECLLERIVRSNSNNNNNSDDFVWSLESLLSSISATVDTCLQLTTTTATTATTTTTASSTAVVTANLQLYFLLLVLIRACFRILFAKLKSGMFVLKQEKIEKGGNGAGTSGGFDALNFTVTTNVSKLLHSLLLANHHISQYIFAHAESLACIQESAIWGSCLRNTAVAATAPDSSSSSSGGVSNSNNSRTSSDIGSTSSHSGSVSVSACVNSYVLSKVDVLQLLSIDYCLALADHLIMTQLPSMAIEASTTATTTASAMATMATMATSITNNEEESDLLLLQCINICVDMVLTALSATPTPNPNPYPNTGCISDPNAYASYKLKLLVLPLVSHVYTGLYVCYSCIFRLVTAVAGTGTGGGHSHGNGIDGTTSRRHKKLDIYSLSFDSYRTLWQQGCLAGGPLLISTLTGLVTKYLHIIREYLNPLSTGNAGKSVKIRVDEKFRKQLLGCYSLDVEKPGLISLVPSSSPSVSVEDNKNNSKSKSKSSSGNMKGSASSAANTNADRIRGLLLLSSASSAAAASPFNPLDTPFVLLLFHVMYAYQHHPEATLYSVRVLAKLTVFEQVRQICYSKAKLVMTCLASAIVIRESRELQESPPATLVDTPGSSGSTGTGSTTTTTTTCWPAWYSFPLLSRGIYILGNLTTTNEQNRQLLYEYPEFLTGLHMLLNRCSGLLFRRQQDNYSGSSSSISDSKQMQKQKQLDTTNTNTASSSSSAAAVAAAVAAEEVVIKLIRLVANTSINAHCGRHMVTVSVPVKAVKAVEAVKAQVHNTMITSSLSSSTTLLELVARVLKHIIRRHNNINGVGNAKTDADADADADADDSDSDGDIRSGYDITKNSNSNSTNSNVQYQQHEELLLNAVASITNLTFYATEPFPSPLTDVVDSLKPGQQQLGSEAQTSTLVNNNNKDWELLEDQDKEEGDADTVDTLSTTRKPKYTVPVSLLCSLTKSMSRYLHHPNIEIVTEIIRALGNLTRCEEVIQQVIIPYNIHLLLMNLLATSPVSVSASASSPRLRHCIVGILINLSCDATCRKFLLLLHRGGNSSNNSNSSNSTSNNSTGDGDGGDNSSTNDTIRTHLFHYLLVYILKKTKFNQSLSLQSSILACQVLCNFLGDIRPLLLLLDRQQSNGSSSSSSASSSSSSSGLNDSLDESSDSIKEEEGKWILELCEQLSNCIEELVDCAKDLIHSHQEATARPTTASAIKTESMKLTGLLQDLVHYGEIVLEGLQQ